MKVRDFIKKRLQELIEYFPQMKVSYEFDNLSGSHFIEVLPSNEFRENSKYSEYETKLIIDFISEFPNEDIVFITENDLIEIENPSLVIKGNLFDNKVLFWNSNIWSNNSIMNFNLQLKNFPKNNISSIDLINEGFGSFASDNIIVNPIKEEAVEIIVTNNDFVFAA